MSSSERIIGSRKIMPFEVRKVQNPNHLVMVSIPKRFADWLRITKGSLVKIQMDRDDTISVGPDKRLIITKVHIAGIDDDGNVSSVGLEAA